MAEENRCTRVDSSAVIPGSSKGFARMRSPADIVGMEATAPGFHRVLTDAIVASGKIRGNDQTQAPVRRTRSEDLIIDAPKPKRQIFAEGARVTATSGQARGKKLTIIAAKIGYTSKTHTPVHKVADKQGNVWNEVESKLKFR